ncbi:hypothetical protein THAOC_26573 [Thalassiosira oceanica]|uniref:Uncharacterized protein n=1 Tax=Thalassiosira oceanica TaxID=159749 RepID=K0RNQ3_THAOC|nr:hypothetical protein THAOC_26573 [Thalassiosira oceanica]|eukprot:EJK53899.1 hypothetical protein THAOC_26573 [Thalassiosira oceanica]
MLLLLSSFFGGTCEVGAARGSIRTPEDAAPLGAVLLCVAGNDIANPGCARGDERLIRRPPPPALSTSPGGRPREWRRGQGLEAGGRPPLQLLQESRTRALVQRVVEHRRSIPNDLPHPRHVDRVIPRSAGTHVRHFGGVDGKVVPGVEEADGSVVIVDEPDPRHVADDVARLVQQEMEVPRPLGEEEARHVRGHLGKIGTVQDRVGHFRVGARSLAALRGRARLPVEVNQ